MDTTLWAVPFPDAEVLDFRIDTSTTVTCLAGWIERIDFHQISMPFILLVLQHGKEL